MGREDDAFALGNVALVLDEDRPASLEVADDVSVVDDLLANVDGRPVQVEELLDGVDGAFDAGAVAARRGEKDPLDHAASVVRRSPSLRAGRPRRLEPVHVSAIPARSRKVSSGGVRRVRATSGLAPKKESPPLGGSVRRASQIAHRGLRGQVRTAAVRIAQCPGT